MRVGEVPPFEQWYKNRTFKIVWVCFFFRGGDKPSGIMTWESGNSSPIRIFMLHFIGVHFFLLAHLTGSHPFWICRHIFALKAMEMNRSCILEGGWLVEIKWPIWLSSWLLFFDLGSILPKIHMPPEKGPGTKTKRLVFLPLSFMGHVSFLGFPPRKLTSQWKIHHLKMHFLF